MEKRKRIEEAVAKTNDEPTQIDSIAAIRGWFRPKDNSEIYSAIQEYMHDAADLETTVASITKPIDDAVVKQKADDYQWGYLWNSVLHSAKRVPFRQADRHTKLVDFVRAIKDHPGPSSTQPYKSLPGFGMQARETFNDSPIHDLGQFAPEIHAWTNLNYFLARLTESEVHTFYMYAIWAMRDALEEKADPPKAWYDAHVPAAAAWVFALGSQLYAREEDLTPKNEYEGNPARGGALWTGGSEFSKARWDFWKRRFKEVAEEEEASEETKKIAKEAVAEMQRAESS